MITLLLSTAAAQPITVHKDASIRCNDGTQAGWYVRTNPLSNEYVLVLPGGGLCDDLSAPCSSRPTSKTSMIPMAEGASVPAFPDATGGIFTLLGDVNMVQLHYCTSDLYSGQVGPVPTSAGSWYFHGSLHVRAALEALAVPADARLLVIGQSAGCFGLMATTWPANTMLVGDGCYVPTGFADPALLANFTTLWGTTLASVYAAAYPDIWFTTSDHDPVILSGLQRIDNSPWRTAIALEAAANSKVYVRTTDDTHKYLGTQACLDDGYCASILSTWRNQ